MSLKAGDVVRLKSGGPAMTIEFEPFIGGVIRLVWIAPDGEMRRGQVDGADSLEPANPEAIS